MATPPAAPSSCRSASEALPHAGALQFPAGLAGRAPCLDAVVKEVMPLTPPIGGFFRFTKRSVLLGGVEISAERVLQVSITRVSLGKSLAVLEIRLLAVGLLEQLQLRLIDDQDLTLMVIPSPTPRDGLRVEVPRPSHPTDRWRCSPCGQGPIRIDGAIYPLTHEVP